MTSIPIQWTSNLQNNPEAKEAFEALLKNNTSILERLKTILAQRDKELEQYTFTLSSYIESGWPYTQAHINGRRAMIQEINKLLTF